MPTSHRNIVFNELLKSQEILKNGFGSGTVTKFEVAILAKYFFSIGITGTKLRKALIDFCKQHSANFNEIVYRDLISYAVKIAEKYNLKISDPVIITSAEMNIIRNLPYKYAKVLFIMVAMAKIAKQNKTLKNQRNESGKYYCNYSMRELVRIAKISMSESDIKKMKHYLDGENGYISATEVSSKSWEVCIINNDSEPEVVIENMNNLHNYLPVFCERCKKTLNKENKKQKYCMECANIVNSEKTKEKTRQKREKCLI